MRMRTCTSASSLQRRLDGRDEKKERELPSSSLLVRVGSSDRPSLATGVGSVGLGLGPAHQIHHTHSVLDSLPRLLQ